MLCWLVCGGKGVESVVQYNTPLVLGPNNTGLHMPHYNSVIVGGNAPRVHSKQQEEYDDDEFRLPAIRQTSSMANGGHQQLPLMPMPIRRPRVHRAAGPAHPYNSSAGGPMTLPRAASDPYGHARPMRRPTRPAAYDDDDDDDVDGGVYDAREDVVYEYAYAAPRVGTKRSSYEMRGGDGVPHHPARQGWTGSWNTSKQMPAESSASQVGDRVCTTILFCTTTKHTTRHVPTNNTNKQHPNQCLIPPAHCTGKPRGWLLYAAPQCH